LTEESDSSWYNETNRICIPASENNYAGIPEWDHYFTLKLKALPDRDIHISGLDVFMRDMAGEVYDFDAGTVVNLGSTIVYAGVDLVIGPFQLYCDNTRDIIFEVSMNYVDDAAPMSSDIVPGHSMWNVSWPGPVITEHVDSGHRVLIAELTEVF